MTTVKTIINEMLEAKKTAASKKAFLTREINGTQDELDYKRNHLNKQFARGKETAWHLGEKHTVSSFKAWEQREERLLQWLRERRAEIGNTSTVTATTTKTINGKALTIGELESEEAVCYAGGCAITNPFYDEMFDRQVNPHTYYGLTGAQVDEWFSSATKREDI